MIITTPVTDYIPASILTNLNDIVLRGAADPERAAGLLRAIGTHIGYDTRSAGSGDQVITGVGYNASVVVFLAHGKMGVNEQFSIGFDDGTTHECIFKSWTGLIVHSATKSLFVWTADTPDNHQGYISAKDGDGFTITWVKNGTPPEAGFIYWCIP